MIKKIDRPIKQITQQARLQPNIAPPQYIFWKLLRRLAPYIQSRGRVILSYKYMGYDTLEDYDSKGYRVIVDTIYVGKRRCKDATLRHLLRQTKMARGLIHLPSSV